MKFQNVPHCPRSKTVFEWVVLKRFMSKNIYLHTPRGRCANWIWGTAPRLFHSVHGTEWFHKIAWFKWFCRYLRKRKSLYLWSIRGNARLCWPLLYHIYCSFCIWGVPHVYQWYLRQCWLGIWSDTIVCLNLFNDDRCPGLLLSIQIRINFPSQKSFCAFLNCAITTSTMTCSASSLNDVRLEEFLPRSDWICLAFNTVRQSVCFGNSRIKRTSYRRTWWHKKRSLPST